MRNTAKPSMITILTSRTSMENQCAVCEAEDEVMTVGKIEVHITKNGKVCECSCHKSK